MLDTVSKLHESRSMGPTRSELPLGRGGSDGAWAAQEPDGWGPSIRDTPRKEVVN